MQDTPISGSEVSLKASLKHVDEAFHQFADFMQSVGLSIKHQNEWKTIFMEALTNATIHGCKNDEEEKINILWSIRGNSIQLEVTDSGPGPCDKKKNIDPHNTSKASGRGLYIIKELADSCTHWNSTKGHKLIIKKRHNELISHFSANELLSSALEELTSSYESLSAFYRLGESLMESEEIDYFFDKALNNLKEIVANDAIFVSFSKELHPQLLKRLSKFNLNELACEYISLDHEIVWETSEEVKIFPIFNNFENGIAIPIKANKQNLGLLVLGRKNNTDNFSAADLSITRTFSDLLGIAIAHANNILLRDYAQGALKELEIASHFQEKLIPVPKLPENSKWNFFATRKSAKEVSGDYVDAIYNEKKGLYFIIVDVMGKGITAAFLAAMIRTAFHLLLDFQTELLNIIESLNHIVYNQTRNLTLFATTAIAHIPLDLSSIEIVNAGHPPALLLKDKEIKEIEPSGPPLGIFKHSQYQKNKYILDKKTQLLMVTDGLFEWDHKGKIWGWDNFIDSIPNPIDSPNKLWNHIQSNINLGTNNHTRDDQTLLFWNLS